jgi:hypothetical protein
MNCTINVQIARVGALCVVLLGVMTGAALAQITGTVNPSAVPAETPAGVCKPIGLTASGEAVFPFQCKEFIERQKAANQKNAERNQKPAAAEQRSEAAAEDKTAEAKPVTAERKPAAEEEKPPAVQEKAAAKQPDSVVPESGQPASEQPGTVPLPKRAKREARGRSVGPAGCTRFRTYDSASGTYRTYDGQRRQCREMMPTATATNAALPASRIPLPLDSPKATPPSESSAAAVDSRATLATIPDSTTSVTAASTASVPVAVSRPVVEDAKSNTRTIEAQVAAATMVAEHLTVATAAPPPDTNGTNPDKPGRAEARGEKSAPASANDTDLLVAVLMARPDITSVAALTGKTIAIDDKYSASSGSVRTAIVAAGASEIQLSGGQATAITRLVNGEVPAAIVALVSADAAEGFPDIKGFKILHIPLSPRSLEARP